LKSSVPPVRRVLLVENGCNRRCFGAIYGNVYISCRRKLSEKCGKSSIRALAREITMREIFIARHFRDAGCNGQTPAGCANLVMEYFMPDCASRAGRQRKG